LICKLAFVKLLLLEVEQIENVTDSYQVLVIIIIDQNVLFFEAKQVNVPIFD
jgi:hypothetical protein